MSYLEMENDGPDEAECELWVAVDNVLAANVDQFDFLVTEEPQGSLDVLDGMEAHSTPLARL